MPALHQAPPDAPGIYAVALLIEVLTDACFVQPNTLATCVNDVFGIPLFAIGYVGDDLPKSSSCFLVIIPTMEILCGFRFLSYDIAQQLHTVGLYPYLFIFTFHQVTYDCPVSVGTGPELSVVSIVT